MSFNRVILIVLDSAGIGEMPDAATYGDAGSDTLGNLARRRRLSLPVLCSLGLANIKPLSGLRPEPRPVGSYGRCALASPGKDTTTGHWEMAGILLEEPFPLYPEGFPAEILSELGRRTGRGVLGNKAASGTEIIKELGEEHMESGALIVYTSADSVFQIAAHEEVVPLDELYRICQAAREILAGPHAVGRVIARPFTGEPGAFERTPSRRDFAIPPPEGMLLDRLAERDVPVTTVGKIADVFCGRGITESIKTRSNEDGMRQLLRVMDQEPEGLMWTNLNDFDMLYGHRNDAEGYAKALEEVDRWLPELLDRLRPADLAIITADHGCDPATPSTDHSREYVPLLAFGPGVRSGVDLGSRGTLADIGQTVAENFRTAIAAGTSFRESVSM